MIPDTHRVLTGDAAKKFLEMDAKAPTKAELDDLRESEEFYLMHCSDKEIE